MVADVEVGGRRAPLAEPDDAPELLSGDDLERIDAVGGCDEAEFAALVRTASFYRQEAVELRDELARLRDGGSFERLVELCESVRLAVTGLQEEQGTTRAVHRVIDATCAVGLHAATLQRRARRAAPRATEGSDGGV